jgi:hypothetical protein
MQGYPAMHHWWMKLKILIPANVLGFSSKYEIFDLHILDA